MTKYTTADRLKQIMRDRDIKQVDIINLAKPYCKLYKVKLGRNDLSQYVSGKVEPRQTKLYVLSRALNVNPAWLMGYDVPMEKLDDGPSDILTNNIEDVYPIILKYEKLNELGKQKTDEYINDLLENPKYTKSDASAVKKTKTSKRNYEIAAWGADGTKGTYKSPKREIT